MLQNEYLQTGMPVGVSQIQTQVCVDLNMNGPQTQMGVCSEYVKSI